MIEITEVLIVDDNPEICLLVCHILKNIGIPADTAYSLADATDRLGKNAYSIILLDNHLPDGLGIDFISYIKQNFADSKIVLITAFDDIETKTRALEIGADIFIGKPFTKDHLCEVVTELLSIRN
jgi:two-component system OmpR family response regulator